MQPMNYFKRCRDAAGITQRTVALRLNITTSAVSQWERDETIPQLYHVPALACLYGVSEAEMLGVMLQMSVSDQRQSPAALSA